MFPRQLRLLDIRVNKVNHTYIDLTPPLKEFIYFDGTDRQTVTITQAEADVAKLRSISNEDYAKEKLRAAQPPPPSKGHRTQEEIVKQCEARVAELEDQAALTVTSAPLCTTCKFFDGIYNCSNPLIVGFDKVDNYRYDWLVACYKGNYANLKTYKSALCGPEKALWEPRLSRYRKFLEFVGRLF